MTKHLRTYWQMFLVAILFSVAASVLSLLQPVLVADIVSALERSTEVLYSVLALLSLLLASAVLSGLQAYTLGTLGERVTSRIRATFIRAILHLPISAIENYRRADLVTRATADSTLLRIALTDGAGQIIGGVIMFVGALIAMALVSPTLLLATLASVALGLAFLLTLSGRMRNASREVQEGVSQFGSTLDQSIFAYKTVRSLDATDWAISRLDRAIDTAMQAGLRFAKISATITPLSGVVMQVSLAAVLGLGAFQVANGTLLVSQLVAFIMYVFLLLAPVGQAVSAITSLAQATAAAQRLAEVEELVDALDGAQTQTSSPVFTSSLVTTDAPAVEFTDVRFAYEASRQGDVSKGRAALNDVTFVVPIGAKVGIVGPSGAGKSTIFNLIAGFYTPQRGAVRLAGAGDASAPDVRNLGLIGLVEQDAPVIAGTLRDNLTLGNAEISDSACRDALARANLGYLNTRGPGLDLELSDQGTNLSGGERQRLAIARVLLRKRPILLLDESTSQMDSENELQLRDAIAEAGQGRTTIVVAHRLSTIIDSDFVIVVRDGEIEAIGDHNNLVATSPTYSMFAQQQRLTRH